MSVPLRVLIIEDSEDDARLLVRELRRGGFEPSYERVERAETLGAALARQAWDVVISDYTIPGFSGLAAFKIVDASGLDLPFIFVSGTIGEDVAVATMKAGAHDYILKNNLARLVPAIERELREAEHRRKRKRAEEALRESEERLRIFIEHAPAAIAMLDIEMKYVAVSQRWLADYSLGKQDIIGHSHYEIFPEIPTRWREIHQRCLRGATEKCEEDPFPRADGRMDWIRWEIHPWHKHTGEIGGILLFSEIITERKRAENERALLMTAIEQSADGIMITNVNGIIEYVNPAFSRMTGYSRAEVAGQNPRFLKSAKQEPSFYHQLWGTILKGEVWQGELVNRRKDGSEYPEEMNITPVRNTQGEVTYFIATKHDVTARRELEQAFRQAQKMEAVGRLAGGVATTW